MSPQKVSTDRAPQPAGPYSQAIVANGFLFTAGQTPHHPSTKEIVGTTVGDQTRQTMANVSAVLEAHGLTFADVVKVTVHLQNLERDRAGFNAAYAEFAQEPYPVRTTVGSGLGGFLVEIDVVAAVPEPHEA